MKGASCAAWSKTSWKQVKGHAQREYPDGRLGGDDLGSLAMAFAADKKKNVVVIDFGKPVMWLALPPKEVNDLINMLKSKLQELGHPVTINV